MNKIDALNQSRIFSDPVVTPVEAYHNFYPAEEAHQDYYKNIRFTTHNINVDQDVKRLLKNIGGSSMIKKIKRFNRLGVPRHTTRWHRTTISK